MVTQIKAVVRKRARLVTLLAIVVLLLVVAVTTVWASPPKQINIRYSIEINRPAAEVWAFTSNPANSVLWIKGLRENKLNAPGKMEVGATGRQVVEMGFGMVNVADYRITEYVPGQMLSYQVTSGPLEDFTQIEAIEEIPGESSGRARINWSLQGTLDGASKLAAPIYTRMFEQRLAQDFATLKNLLESSGN